MVSSRDLLSVLFSTCVGRTDDYLVQQEDGSYLRQFRTLTSDVLRHHLNGWCTIATYVVTEDELCRFAVFDADDEEGLLAVLGVQQTFADLGVSSYLEQSRRGIHLWLFLEEACSPLIVRQALLPFCPVGVEFFPKRDWASFEHPGSLVRVPLGVHLRSGRRYPFGEYCQGCFEAYASNTHGMLTFLSRVERVPVSVLSCLAERNEQQSLKNTLQKAVRVVPVTRSGGGVRWASIAEWCLEQDPCATIGRYVDLDSSGMGCCPFGSHHVGGSDSHPSLYVYDPVAPNVMCWWCHAAGEGGSVFDFLRLYYGLTARSLWHRILGGSTF